MEEAPTARRVRWVLSTSLRPVLGTPSLAGLWLWWTQCKVWGRIPTGYGYPGTAGTTGLHLGYQEMRLSPWTWPPTHVLSKQGSSESMVFPSPPPLAAPASPSGSLCHLPPCSVTKRHFQVSRESSKYCIYSVPHRAQHVLTALLNSFSCGKDSKLILLRTSVP